MKIHSVPKSINAIAECQEDEQSLIPFAEIIFKHPVNCELLIESSKENDLSQCNDCISFAMQAEKKSQITEKRHNQPAKSNVPFSVTSTNSIKLMLQNQRLKCAQLESEILKMKKLFKYTKCPKVDNTLNKDFIDIFNKNHTKVTLWNFSGSRYQRMIK